MVCGRLAGCRCSRWVRSQCASVDHSLCVGSTLQTIFSLKVKILPFFLVCWKFTCPKKLGIHIKQNQACFQAKRSQCNNHRSIITILVGHSYIPNSLLRILDAGKMNHIEKTAYYPQFNLQLTIKKKTRTVYSVNIFLFHHFDT